MIGVVDARDPSNCDAPTTRRFARVQHVGELPYARCVVRVLGGELQPLF